MTQKWNLQDIKPAQPRRRPSATHPDQLIRKPQPRPIIEAEREDDDVGTITIEDGNKKNRRALWYALGIFFVIIGLAFSVSILTGGAEVIVHPKTREPNVNATFDAFKVADANQLPYELMTLEAEGERQVKAAGQETVESQATGKLLIYNAFQTSPVRLVTNTRFSTADGLIFRVKDAVIVPGYTTAADGTIVPGVISADVYADEVGEQYNVEPGKFNIPGFAGEPEYEKIYGESTEQFTGGFNGERYIIADDELKTAEQALRTELRNSLLERIDSEKPAGFTIFKDAVTFTYVTLPAVEYGEDLATIKEKAIMRIPIFKDDQFASFIAAATIPGYEAEPVRIEDMSLLSFSYTSATTSSTDIGALNSLNFKLTGRPLIVWVYDGENLKADLVGKNKTALNSILGAYPAIERAEAVIKPFWKTKYPLKIADITLTEVIE